MPEENHPLGPHACHPNNKAGGLPKFKDSLAKEWDIVSNK